MSKHEFAVAQLRHLYQQMLDGQVLEHGAAARGLLGPAIEQVESLLADRDRLRAEVKAAEQDARHFATKADEHRSAENALRAEVERLALRAVEDDINIAQLGRRIAELEAENARIRAYETAAREFGKLQNELIDRIAEKEKRIAKLEAEVERLTEQGEHGKPTGYPCPATVQRYPRSDFGQCTCTCGFDAEPGQCEWCKLDAKRGGAR